jgi:TonB family protein
MRPLASIAVAVLFACGSSPAPAKPVAMTDTKPKRVPIEEEEEEADFSMVSTRGRMDPKVAEAGIKPHVDALSECYTSRVGKRKWLGGSVVIHWDISKGGEVTSVKLAESNLGAWPVEQCLVDVAKQATFGKPIGGDADFSIPLDFSAKGRPMDWDEEKSLRAIGGQIRTLDACEEPEEALAPKEPPSKKKSKGKKKPAKATVKATLPEDVLVTIYVGPAGKPESVGFASAVSEIDPAWGACAEQLAMTTWRLPATKAGMAKAAMKYRSP